MGKSRLLTKSDFDGLLCASLLKSAEQIDDIVFVNSFDFESGKIKIEKNDITCNLPYSDQVKVSFSYGKEGMGENNISSPHLESCSAVVYEHFKDDLKNLDQTILQNILKSVAKANSAKFTKEEVLDPKGFDMLNFLLDARTGIGRVRAFKVSNYALMIKLVDLLLLKSQEEILQMEDIQERIEYYRDSSEDYVEMLEECGKLDGTVLIVDVRKESYVKPANRFVKYALFPEAKFSIQIMWGLRKMNTVFAVGKTIFGRNEEVDLEQILKKHGGISRRNSGSIQVESERADEILESLVEELKNV